MQTLHITLKVPDGTQVMIAGLDALGLAPPEATLDQEVRDYWRHYLSDNARKIYGSAARLEDRHGPGFTLEDIAANLSIDYASAHSLHMTSGRTAARWRRERGTPEPVQLLEVEYPETASGVGRRTRYRLPDGVGAIVEQLPLIGGRGEEES